MSSAKGASLTDLRTLNSTTVFHAIRLNAPISRAQLSREVGLTRPTISSALVTLKQAGLIRESQPIPDQPHYGATYFEMVPEVAYFVAAEVDGMRVRLVLGNAAGRRLATRDSYRAVTRPEQLVTHLADSAHEICAEAGLPLSHISMLVVGVPATVRPDTGLLRSRSFSLLDQYAFGPALCQQLSKPVVVDSDVNLAAVGEQSHGAAVGVKDFAYLNMGNRVATGIVLDNQVWRGAHGSAGDIGEHEPELGVAAFVRLAGQLMQGRRVGFGPTPTAVFDAAIRGDVVARQIITEHAARIADSIAATCRVLDLDLVVLGGTIGHRCKPILNRIKNLLRDRIAFPPELAASPLTASAVRTGACTVGAREAMELVTPGLLAKAMRTQDRAGL